MRSRTGGGRPGRPDGNCLQRMGGVTATDSDAHGGPPPIVRNAPPSIRLSNFSHSARIGEIEVRMVQGVYAEHPGASS